MSILQGVLSEAASFMLTHLLITITTIPLLYILLRCSYRLSPFHSLSHVPGPWYARVSSLYLAYHAYIGDESSIVHKLHEKYGPIVRTSHEAVDITDGSALHPIYIEKGGFLKPAFYSNFDIDGHKSIFSAIQPAHRAPRAKAVFGMFSTSNLRAGATTIDDAVDRFIARLSREKNQALKREKCDARSTTIDILEICRALAIDAVTSYLFDLNYGACEEDQDQSSVVEASSSSSEAEDTMTASAMVDSFVAVGRFWYLKPKIFQALEAFMTTFYPDKQTDRSMSLVDSFVERAVNETTAEEKQSTYPGRLLQAGFSESEVRAQCKDLMFAGTDSTAMNLATICFYLVKSPSTYAKLKQEIEETKPSSADLQSLPYLRGVVKEGLRLSMANPSRLPRVVPHGGWTFKSSYLPAGTVVSCTPFELHFNPEVFPDPYSFRPERWLPENKPTEEMTRDHIAFGLGSRQCIARNLATVELFCGMKRIAEDDLLSSLTCVKDKIEILEWFNSHVVGGKIEMQVEV